MSVITDESITQLGRRLRAFFAKNVGNASDVDDLLQSTLLKIVRAQQQLKDGDKLHSWAMRIARNNLCDYRSRNKQVEWADILHDIDDRNDSRQSELHETVLAFLENCARSNAQPEQLVALALRFCFDWTVEEIAAIMDSKPKTIYARIAKAKNLLKQAEGNRVDLQHLAHICNAMCAFMAKAGMIRINGSDFRDHSLIYQAGWLANATHSCRATTGLPTARLSLVLFLPSSRNSIPMIRTQAVK